MEGFLLSPKWMTLNDRTAAIFDEDVFDAVMYVTHDGQQFERALLLPLLSFYFLFSRAPCWLISVGHENENKSTVQFTYKMLVVGINRFSYCSFYQWTFGDRWI